MTYHILENRIHIDAPFSFFIPLAVFPLAGMFFSTSIPSPRVCVPAFVPQVRKGTEADPAYPGETGTTILRRSKTASLAMERSFSLLFPSRSLDFTAASM